MKKYFIKMNDNNNYLSLGNIFNVFKEVSISNKLTIQIELFSVIFNTNNINKTTVNNYCTGYRAISIIYKQYFRDLKNQMKNEYEIFVDMVLSLMSILDDKIYIKNNNSLIEINSNKRLIILINKINELTINDNQINIDYMKKIESLINNNNYYEALIELLSYAILDNEQPKYVNDYKMDLINSEIEEYLKIKLFEGVSYITSLQELAKKDNMYANGELGSLEYSGNISGKRNYQKSYEYYYRSALKNHPKGCWMVSYLILNNKIEEDFQTAWKFLNKSIELGSVAGLNTMGNCYLKGLTPDHKINLEKAIEYFTKASERGYAFAYNNLGKIFEKTNPKNSIEYYKLSADLGDSWALNKVGEHYRLKGDLKTAYIYYLQSINTPLTERCYYGYYNLAKYYYLNGNQELNILSDFKKANEYLKIASKNNIKEAVEELKK